MSDPGIAPIERLERTIEDANNLRVDLGHSGNFYDPTLPPDRLIQTVRTGTRVLKDIYGAAPVGTEAVDAAEFMMRLNGVSTQTAARNASELYELAFPNGDTKTPVLFSRGGRSRLSPNIVMFGTQAAGLPILSLAIHTFSSRPSLVPKHSQPNHYSSAQCFKAWTRDGDWTIRADGASAPLHDLAVTHDPEEFRFYTAMGPETSVVLIGATAVADVLPDFVGNHGSAETIDLMKRIIEKTIDPNMVAGLGMPYEYVDKLLEQRGQIPEDRRLPIFVHGMFAEELDQDSLREALAYTLRDPTGFKFTQELGQRLMHKQKMLKPEDFTQLAEDLRSEIALLFKSVGVKNPQELASGFDTEDQLTPIVISLLEHEAKKIAASKIFTRRKLAKGLSLLALK